MLALLFVLLFCCSNQLQKCSTCACFQLCGFVTAAALPLSLLRLRSTVWQHGQHVEQPIYVGLCRKLIACNDRHLQLKFGGIRDNHAVTYCLSLSLQSACQFFQAKSGTNIDNKACEYMLACAVPAQTHAWAPGHSDGSGCHAPVAIHHD
jgi:hypothetical protein